MHSSAIPINERERLASLFRTALLDGFADERIRPLTELATKLLNRPSAALSVITGQRQLLRATVNLEATNSSRDDSFCSHAILYPDRPMVVEDARLDPRFADNPLVTSRRSPVRFYAGMPVRTSEGMPVGALCVVDQKPGKLSETEVEILRNLAAKIEGIIREQEDQTESYPAQLIDLQRALATGALEIHWQAICEPSILRPIGHEALVRWRREDGIVTTSKGFMPLAATSGLITKVDRFVLRSACALAASHDDGRFVSVNVSGTWLGLKRPALANIVSQALTDSGLTPSRLIIEIAEGAMMCEPTRALQEMRELKKLGVRLALGGLGSGHSTLGYLEQYPFDIYKLDRSVTCGLGSSAGAEAVAYAAIQLAHDLGKATYAVGVETMPQFAFLREEGCDLIQGDLIGQPGVDWLPC